VERIGDQPEQLVGRHGTRQLGGRKVLVEHVRDVVAHLYPRAQPDRDRVLEAQAGNALGLCLQLAHQVDQRRLPFPRPRALPTPPHTTAHKGGGEEGQPAHSMPLPTAVLTTRATSCPVTTTPWLSSSARSR